MTVSHSLGYNAMILIYERGSHLYPMQKYPKDLMLALYPVNFNELLMTVLPLEVTTWLIMEDLSLEYTPTVAVMRDSALFGSMFNSSLAEK